MTYYCIMYFDEVHVFNIGTRESEIFVRIESRIESECSRLCVIIFIIDEQRCADSPGS